VRTKLKNVLSGCRGREDLPGGREGRRGPARAPPVQYSYTDGDLYYFMDQQTFEMIPLAASVIGEDQLDGT
jgi:elongation factor P